MRTASSQVWAGPNASWPGVFDQKDGAHAGEDLVVDDQNAQALSHVPSPASTRRRAAAQAIL
jgi:hypothetical protein